MRTTRDRSRGRGLVGVAAAVLACVAACGGSGGDTRTVTLRSPVACAVGPSPSALLFANGDFQPVGATRTGIAVTVDDVGATLASVPTQTRALWTVVTSEGAGELFWRGLTEVSPQGDVDILLWPSTGACPLSQPTLPLRDRKDAAMGAIDGHRVLVAGGSADVLNPPSFVADVSTGVITRLTNDLLVPRAKATVTPFGSGALVAGGTRPDTGEPLQSAEVFTGVDFDGTLIPLPEGRASHAAVVLVSGETLLVGGEGVRGPLATLEVLDPTTRRLRTDLAQLEVARTHPLAVRLASGEILVAGGLDARGAPVTRVEWLAPDARAHAPHKRSFDLVASAESGLVALPGGGALAVIAPPEPTPGFKNVWVISAQGAYESATPIRGTISAVRLFPGSAGAPVLWTGDRWLRWQPWRGEFGVAEIVSQRGPEGTSIASPDLGLATWLAADNGHATIMGLRFDMRGPYTTDSARGPLLAEGTAYMAPDRLVTPSDTALTFNPERGLVVGPGSSAFVTDATFAAFSIDLALTGAAPLIVLRDAAGAELEIGGGTCPLVIPDGASSLHVDRDGEKVTVRLSPEDVRPCRTPLAADARVSIGLRGAEIGSSAKNLVITRR